MRPSNCDQRVTLPTEAIASPGNIFVRELTIPKTRIRIFRETIKITYGAGHFFISNPISNKFVTANTCHVTGLNAKL